MTSTVLVTGGYGFLGRAVAHQFKTQAYRVVGIGRGRWAAADAKACGFDLWLDADVTLSSLMTLNERFDIVVHCAGNGSVGYSLTNPLQDFYKTVQGTADLLEYLRLSNPGALLIYPSSAGVYGAKPDAPISVHDASNPISPYGYHKRIAEELLASYSQSYGIRVVVIRFFSIYGTGLTKQLLWDAGAKLLAAQGAAPAIFWGTGEETRDWISSVDAAGLVMAATRSSQRFLTVNGASGKRRTIRNTLDMLKVALGVDTEFEFNGTVREGDPRFYHADISEALRTLDWAPTISFAQGLDAYVNWLTARREQAND